MVEDFKSDYILLFKGTLYIDCVVFVVFCFLGYFSLSLILSFAIGIALVMFHFHMLIRHSLAAVYEAFSPKRKAMSGYLTRYMLVGVVFVICIKVPFINEWAVILHMIYPKLVFTITELMRKEN